MAGQPFTKVPTKLLEQLYSSNFTLIEVSILLRIIRQTYGWNRENDDMTVKQIAQSIGSDRSNVSKTLKHLISKQCVVKSHGKYGYVLEINTKYRQWNTVVKSHARGKKPHPPWLKATRGVVKSHAPRGKKPHTKDTLQKTLSKDTPTKDKNPMSSLKKPKLDVSEKPQQIDLIRQVFEHWQAIMKHPRAKLDDKRKRKIRMRLKDGYSVQELCNAIEGCAKTPHNMGLEGGAVYDDVELICRDASHVDRFLKNYDNPPPIRTTTEQGRANAFSQVAHDFIHGGGKVYDA